ncbi:MAG: RnfABCDGE type electron transport complex subunit D [Bacteroides sp.]|nr:RnfABCDGE type electron transport complex subunit D [Bacteroides sp.]
MNIDKYIRQLDSSKSNALKYLKMISWHQPLTEENTHHINSQSNNGSENIVAPVVGGVGCVSLVGGLIADKIGFTILGGALMIGAFLVKRLQKPSQKVEMNPKVDFQKFVQSLDEMIYENVKIASDQWNSTVSSIHKSINQEILSSDMPENRKTEMLSVASEEFPLLLSTMDISIQLQSLVSSEDLIGMKNALEDYHDKCIDTLHQVYQSQLNVYKNLEN